MKIGFSIFFLLGIILTGFCQIDSIQVLRFQKSGTAILGPGLANLEIPAGFKFLDSDQSKYVLTILWGNPPSETLGLLFPDAANDTIPDTWAIDISYSDEGHIDDEDASEIDYDELLTNMQEGAREAAEERKKNGFAPFEILGWAAPPYYDANSKKLHWAKKLQFEGEEGITLNYNIRILGKAGVLELNAIGSLQDLAEINQNLKPILASINFSEGNGYADFKEGVDKKATYGIAGLIAGGVLMKTGVLAKLGLVLVKFGKVIVMALIAGAGAIYKWVTGRNRDSA